MSEQLTFDWPVGVALGVADFFVSAANDRAYAMLQAPDTWPDRKLIIAGPAGAGKSHLAGIFATQMDAQHLSATALPDTLPPAGRSIVVEDLDQLAPDANEFMFHLHNHLRHTGGAPVDDRAPRTGPLGADPARSGQPDASQHHNQHRRPRRRAFGRADHETDGRPANHATAQPCQLSGGAHRALICRRRPRRGAA